MSKQLFELMQMQTISESFPTKKQIQNQATNFVTDLIENGEQDKLEMFCQAVRINDALSIVTDTLKKSLPHEKMQAFGVEVNPVTGRQMIQFADDPIYAELQKQLKDREELLKVALKTDAPFYDSEGIEVPKVSVKYASDSLTVKY